MLKKTVSFAVATAFVVTPFTASAQSVADLTAQINALLQQLAALRSQVSQQSVPATPLYTGGNCVQLTYNLYLDIEDVSVNGEVSKLQRFLAQDTSIYPEGRITGYFGPATERAVRRWQARNGVISSGTPDTTGYGAVGPRTREAMARGCGTTTPPQQYSYIISTRVEDKQVSFNYHHTSGNSIAYLVFNPTGEHVANLALEQSAGSARITLPSTAQAGTYYLRLMSGIAGIGSEIARSQTFELGTSALFGTLTASPSSGPAPLSVTFSVRTSSPLSSQAFIKFGDGGQASSLAANLGNSGYEYIVAWTYSLPGAYVVSVHEDGARGEIARTLVTVSSPNPQRSSFKLSFRGKEFRLISGVGKDLAQKICDALPIPDLTCEWGGVALTKWGVKDGTPSIRIQSPSQNATVFRGSVAPLSFSDPVPGGDYRVFFTRYANSAVIDTVYEVPFTLFGTSGTSVNGSVNLLGIPNGDYYIAIVNAASGVGGGSSAYVYLTDANVVSSAVPSCTIKTSKSNVAPGEQYTIAWETQNIADPILYMNVKAGGKVSIEKSGLKQFTTPYHGTDIYQIGAGTINGQNVNPPLLFNPLCSVSVTASEASAPTISSFAANPANVAPGYTTTLSWSSIGAHTCNIDKLETNGGLTVIQNGLPATGSMQLVPQTGQSTIVLTCLAPDPGTGKDAPSAQKSLTITGETATPASVMLKASPSYGYSGSATQISWTHTGSPAPKKTDWIAVVPTGTKVTPDNFQKYNWFYTDGLTSGKRNITLSTAGLYDIVYYQDNGYTEFRRASRAIEVVDWFDATPLGGANTNTNTAQTASALAAMEYLLQEALKLLNGIR